MVSTSEAQDDRSAVIAMEQRAVDHAYDCMELDRQSIAQIMDRSRTECPDAGLLPHPDVPPEFGRREDLGGSALVIMRVDLTDDPDDKLTWYLGRQDVLDGEHDRVVVKWTSPLAKEWRLATPDEPRNVRLLRSLHCDERKVLDYSDNVIQVLDSPAVPGQPVTLPTRAEDETADPFLLADLDLARDGLMRDIVETIQRDQLRLVADERSGPLVIQGGPGTGKTAVGLHRVAWLLDNDRFDAGQVLVIGPHQGFLRYVSQVLPRLGSRGVNTVDIARLWEGEVRGTDVPDASLVKSDERMALVLRRAIEHHIRPDLLPRRSGAELRFPFRGTTLSIPFAELGDFAREARDSSGPYLTRRRHLVDRILDRLMHEYSAATHRQAHDPEVRFQLKKQEQVAKLVNDVWPTMTAERALRQLLSDEEAVQIAAAGVLTVDEQLIIQRPQARRIADEPWTADDLVCLEELRYLLSGDEPQRYRHIVVDEAQDLTPMQARSLARRCSTGSMTVLGDLAQATGIRQYDTWGRLAGILARGDDWHMAELRTGYRVPTEVMDFAKPLKTAVSPSTRFPVSVRPPSVGALTLVPVHRERLAAETATLAVERARPDGGQVRSVAVIVPDDEALLHEVREALAAMEHGREITVLSTPMAKGLEFDHVLVIEPRLIVQQGPAGARRLYVAITRCTQTLTIVHSAPLPVELGGPQPVMEHAQLESPAAPLSGILDTVTSVERYETLDHFFAALKDKVATDRRNHTHEQLRHSLVAELYGADLDPVLDSPFADIICTGPSGSALYEIVSDETMTYAQMRDAAIRVLEIEQACGERTDHPFLVLPQAPQDAWAADLLDKALNVSVIWRGPTGWDGVHLDVALGRTPPKTQTPEA